MSRVYLFVCVLATVALGSTDYALAQVDAGQDQLQEITVTGTLIRGATPSGSELIVLNHNDIVNTGATTTQDLLATIPQMQSFNGLPTGSPDFSQPVPRVNLRNFSLSGSQGTLLLVDGHPMVGAGILQTSPDPSSIPVAAIQRVEVLPDGASATYGANAVGGVVNFILRKDLNGAESNAQWSNATNYTAYDLNQLIGKSWGSGSILATFDYTEHSSLANNQRFFYRANLTPYGGADHRVNTCPKPTITIGQVNYAAPALIAGTQNLCDPNAQADIYPYQNRSSGLLIGHQDLGDSVSLYGNAYYSRSNTTSTPADATDTFTMSNANPFFRAPPGTGATQESVNYDFAGVISPFQDQVDISSLGVTLGLKIKLPHDWLADLSGDYGSGVSNATTPGLNGAAVNAAAVASTVATALDPFNGLTSAAVLAQIAGSGSYYRSTQGMYNFQLTLDGPVFNLFGNTARAAVGAQRLFQNQNSSVYNLVMGQQMAFPGNTLYASELDTAEYAELQLPFVGTANAMSGVQKLNVSLAVRHDNYNDFGGTTNPKYTIAWSPVQGATLRGTYSTSFQAPSLGDTNGIDTRLIALPVSPFRPSAYPLFPYLFNPTAVVVGGTPGLQPQTAHSYTAGFDLAPPALAGFTAGVTYYHSDQKDEIGLALPPEYANYFTNPAFSYLWYGPGGNPVTPAVLNYLSAFRLDPSSVPFSPQYQAALLAGGWVFDARRKNLGEEVVDGFDYHLDYAWTTATLGNWSTSIAGTYELTHTLLAAPGTPVFNIAPEDGRIQARGALTWNQGPWNAAGFVNFSGPKSIASTDVGIYHANSFTSVDVRLGYTIKDAGLLSNTVFTVQVNNVFDRAPPFVLVAGGFESPGRDASTGGNGPTPLLRVVTFGVQKKW